MSEAGGEETAPPVCHNRKTGLGRWLSQLLIFSSRHPRIVSAGTKMEKEEVLAGQIFSYLIMKH